MKKNRIKKKRACVFGGSGFLGSHIADKLTAEGYQVTLFDNKSSLWKSKNQKMIIGDILDIDKVSQATKDIDIVYNCAAISDLNQCLNKPIETAKVNILGNLNIMQGCVKNKVKHFIFASSIYVHSRQGSFYRCSKQACEEYIKEFRKSYGLQYTILRYGSLYGPRSDSSNGIYNIISRALKTGIVSYQGEPDTTREYIHIEDAAIASAQLALEKNKLNQSIILTGQEQIQVKYMLKMIKEILGIKKTIKFIKKKNIGHYQITPYSYHPNLSKKLIPDFHIDLGQGLLQVIKNIKNSE